MEEFTEKFAVFSIDVEEWYHLEYFKGHDMNKKYSVIDGLDVFIELIDKYDIRASFFIVGELIHKLKKKLIKLDQRGHDIALHSYYHKRPIEQSEYEFVEDTIKSIKEIKSIFPNNKFGYRAPCFAIDRKRLDKLEKLEIKYDASKIEQKEHPLYVNLDLTGFKMYSKSIYKKNSFKVFEVTSTKFLGINIPIAGGGYLRFIPWPIYEWLLKRHLKQNKSINFYIHPFELSNKKFKLPEKVSLLTKFRYNYNRIKVKSRLEKIINLLIENNYSFKTFDQL